MTRDYLHIDNLHFFGKHGVYADERRVEQEFLVTVRFSLDTEKAGKSDELKDTVDYQEIKNIVGKIIEGQSRYLIESLAEDIADQILQDVRIYSAEVTIKKTAVWDSGVPGVTIKRSRA